jgi:outer membrane protein assembly factor BamB
MPSRRSILAAAALLTAGCSGQSSDPAPSADASDDGSADSGTALPADVAAVTDWRFDTDHESIGLVALGGAPDAPAIYAGRGADPNADDTDASEQTIGEQADATDQQTDERYPLYALTLADGREQWRTSLPNPVRARPVYGGGADAGTGRLYVVTGRPTTPGDSFALHALDPKSGEPHWDVAAGDGRSLHILATTDDTVFVGQRADQPDQSAQSIFALDAVDGTERWRVDSGPVVRDASAHAHRRDTLFVTTRKRLRALEPASGDERWRFETDGAALSGPAFGSRSERVVVGVGTALQALSLTEGTELWRRDLEFEITDIATPAAGMSSTVFVDAPDGRMLAVSPADGSNLWSHSDAGDRGALTVERTSDSLYVGSGGVYAINPISGQQRWSFTPDVAGAVDVHASTAVFASAVDAGRLWALNPGSGERRWGVAPGAGFAGPATAGEVAVLGVDGTVYALDGSTAP